MPSGAAIKVEARVADSEAGLGGVAYTQVTNGTAFSKLGRFIQVRATLTPNEAGASPVLSDIRIQAAPPRPEPTYVSVGVGCAGDVVRTGVVSHIGEDPQRGAYLTVDLPAP